MLYGVPRIRKLSAAGPHASLSQGMFDSKPPDAATSVLATTLCCAPPFATVAAWNRPSRMSSSRASVSYATAMPSCSAVR